MFFSIEKHTDYILKHFMAKLPVTLLNCYFRSVALRLFLRPVSRLNVTGRLQTLQDGAYGMSFHFLIYLQYIKHILHQTCNSNIIVDTLCLFLCNTSYFHQYLDVNRNLQFILLSTHGIFEQRLQHSHFPQKYSRSGIFTEIASYTPDSFRSMFCMCGNFWAHKCLPFYELCTSLGLWVNVSARASIMHPGQFSSYFFFFFATSCILLTGCKNVFFSSL